VITGYEHVDGWDDEQGEQGTDEHAAYQYQADGVDVTTTLPVVTRLKNQGERGNGQRYPLHRVQE